MYIELWSSISQNQVYLFPVALRADIYACRSVQVSGVSDRANLREGIECYYKL